MLSSWSDFCVSDDNACCPSTLQIDWSPVVGGTYKSGGDIYLSTNLPSNQNITLSHGLVGAVIPVPPNTIGASTTLTITNNGCN